jgi:hypothetical protein
MPRASSLDDRDLALNALTNYLLLVKASLHDDKSCKLLFGGDHDRLVEDAVREAMIWLDKNQFAEKTAYQERHGILEHLVSSRMTEVGKGLRFEPGDGDDEEEEVEEEEEAEEDEDFEPDEVVSDEGHPALSAVLPKATSVSDEGRGALSAGLTPGYFDRMLRARRAMRVAAGPRAPLGPPPPHLRRGPYVR